ncbi:MAG: tRNA (adenosine(37)-N6)-threonylcarbamoyltransferase complex ATPase subunit type 1 TsaE [Gammaproteobacteria bacterium]|nr:tRNA (adenosine(37)-N6)-threonylcarbamoyltransferase complex ATPase subunit type 1 TsaE [Gammaproteobacteria bacterium]
MNGQRINSSVEMEQLGAALAKACRSGGLIFLEGELGAGKTTLVRGLLRALGWQGKVKSPTYTLLEDYEIDGYQICHMDLYRLLDPEELEWLGIRDVLNQDTLCLVEWPDKGSGILPAPDLRVEIHYRGEAREVHLLASGDVGDAILSNMNALT